MLSWYQGPFHSITFQLGHFRRHIQTFRLSGTVTHSTLKLNSYLVPNPTEKATHDRTHPTQRNKTNKHKKRGSVEF